MTLLGWLTAAALGQVVVDDVHPAPLPMFSPMQWPDDIYTALRFEITLRNAGTKTVVLDGLSAAYAEGTWDSFERSRDSLRGALTGGDRRGWGLDRLGTTVDELYEHEWVVAVDISVPGVGGSDSDLEPVYEAVHGATKIGWGSDTLEVSEFLIGSRIARGTWSFARPVDFLGFEGRANAVFSRAGELTTAVYVGGAHAAASGPDPFAMPWQFAAVKTLSALGAEAWKVTIDFPGCSAEAVDVDPLPLTQGVIGYFLTGNATCDGVQKVAVAALDPTGETLWTKLFSIPGNAVTVGGGAVDPDGIPYVVGQWGSDILAIKLSATGDLDPLYGAGGFAKIAPSGFTDAMAWEGAFQADGKLVVAADAKRNADAKYVLGAARFTTSGNFDNGYGTKGWTSTNIPGYDNAYGRDIALVSDRAVVTGHAASATSTVFAGAAFSSTGKVWNGFDLDGRITIPFPEASRSLRSARDGDFLILVGSSGVNRASARISAVDGSLDDPTILSPGEERVYIWGDNNLGESRPSSASASFAWQPWPTGAISNTVYSQSFDTSAQPIRRFPLPRSEVSGELWATKSIDALESMWFAMLDDLAPWEFPQRYAYSFELAHYVGERWIPVEPPILMPVTAMSSGQIIGCDNPVSPGIALSGSIHLPASWEIGDLVILTEHGDVESYYGLVSSEVNCPVVQGLGPIALDEPIPVSAGERIGDAYDLQVMVTTPFAIDGFGLPDAPVDGLPLLFNDVYVVDSSTAYQDLPALPDVLPVGGLFDDRVLLLQRPPPPPPPDETSCSKVDDSLPLDEAGAHPDGDFGIGWYCPDNEETLIESVCVDQGGHGECRSCAEGAFPGCPCSNDMECGVGDLVCKGKDASNSFGVPPGRCYPYDSLPTWQCPSDCRANLGEGAWCFNNFYHHARCFDSGTDEMDALQCYEAGWTDADACDLACDSSACLLECSGGGPQGAYDGDCTIECLNPSDCQDLWGFPSEYVCELDEGVAVCVVP